MQANRRQNRESKAAKNNAIHKSGWSARQLSAPARIVLRRVSGEGWKLPGVVLPGESEYKYGCENTQKQAVNLSAKKEYFAVLC